LTGKRVYPRADSYLYLDKGDYGKDTGGVWRVRLPLSGSLMSLLDKALPVTEESGGRITVGGIIEDQIRNSETEIDVVQWKLRSGEWTEVGRKRVGV
jgi:hypothetical protein